MSIEAMRLALDALEELMPTGSATLELRESAIIKIRQAIKQAEKAEKPAERLVDYEYDGSTK